MTLVIRSFFILLLFTTLVVTIYSNTLDSPFTLDDWANIRGNDHIAISRLDLQDLVRAGFDSPNRNRPVANISFALNHLVGQYTVSGYHLVNILIHLAAGVFLYFFLKITFSLSKETRPSRSALQAVMVLSAGIWAVHPLQTQAVTYIVQRMTSMAALFYVISILLYAKGRLLQRSGTDQQPAVYGYFGGCLLAGILALGCKEIAATLPFFLLLYEWYFFQDVSGRWLKHRFVYIAAIFILLFVTGLIYMGLNPVDVILSSYRNRDFTMEQRMLTQLRVVPFYLSLLLFPHPSRLNLDHDFMISNSLLAPPSTLLGLVALIGLVVLAVFTAKKQRVLSFCIIWTLGQLVIESSLIGLEIVFEHRMYLPSMLAISGIVLTIDRYMKPKWLVYSLLATMVVFCSIWTYQRNSVWKDEMTLLADIVAKSPNKTRAQYNYGFALAARGHTAEAVRHYRKALLLAPESAAIHTNLGIEFAAQNKIEDAKHHYREALRYRPDFALAHIQMGLILMQEGRINDAIDHYQSALKHKPDSVLAHINLANAFLEMGRLSEASLLYQEAIRLDPDAAVAYNNLGAALLRIGKVDEAIRLFRKAMQINPDYRAARQNFINTARARRSGLQDTQQ